MKARGGFCRPAFLIATDAVLQSGQTSGVHFIEESAA